MEILFLEPLSDHTKQHTVIPCGIQKHLNAGIHVAWHSKILYTKDTFSNTTKYSGSMQKFIDKVKFIFLQLFGVVREGKAYLYQHINLEWPQSLILQ